MFVVTNVHRCVVVSFCALVRCGGAIHSDVVPLSPMCFDVVISHTGEDIVRQSCAMVRRWRIFGDFFRPVFSTSRVHHVSDLHPEFAVALRPHHV